MTLKKSISLLLFLCCIATTYGQLKSPEEFLGYQLGESFTRHHRVMDYFNHVADEKDNIVIQQYGQTYEDRPLVAAFITSEKNAGRLDEIRLNNLRRTKLESGDAEDDGITLVWLSYNVHGNESVSTEAAMQTIYLLANPEEEEIQKWLENTVVIIDPCINPDGRDRYVNWYYQYSNHRFDPNPDGKEHHEPWISGRSNHYMFDLNRDWAWLSQQESQARLKLYNQWMPHVHVDFHEQGVNSPYYFAPAAEPYHEVITDWQRQFQVTIGKNHARYFDAYGWLYFTKEVFDLLYPSYGDTYPTFNGAIGMTYEQGGSGRAGLGVITAEGDTLTLKERIAHHVTTGLSTIEISSLNANKLVDEFSSYFNEGNNAGNGRFKSYVVSAANGEKKLKRLAALLDAHKVKYGTVSQSRSVKGYDYQNNRDATIRVNSADLVIPSAQPKSRFVRALFEPKAGLSDSVTYDITAWSIPYSFGLSAYASLENLSIQSMSPIGNNWTKPQIDGKTYAFISSWESLNDVKWLGELLQQGIKVRYSKQAFRIGSQNFGSGSLIITRTGNEHLGEDFDNYILELAASQQMPVIPVYTGMVDAGKDLGSSEVRYIHPPKIAVYSGGGTSTLAFGEVWHYFEQQINYPVTIVDDEYFSRVDLHNYDILIIPHGYHGDFLSESVVEKLNQWVRSGGKLITMENSNSYLTEAGGFGIKKYSAKENGKNKPATSNEDLLKSYENRERDQISKSIFGGIFKAKIDDSHPLGFGYKDNYYTLKRSEDRYLFLENGWNVITIAGKENLVSGFAGAKALKQIENSLVFGVEPIGRGQAIYMIDNPIFRAFWEEGKLMFGNAVFLVGQ